jgi:heme/copper-type cytochrome/quinol oxidase subunit 4
MSNDRKQIRIKNFKQTRKESWIGFAFWMIMLFLIPFVIWLATDNEDLILVAVFIDLPIVVYLAFKWMNKLRKRQAAEYNTEYVSVGDELRKEIQNRPRMDAGSKKVVMFVLLIFGGIIAIVVIIAAVIMAQFNARWS